MEVERDGGARMSEPSRASVPCSETGLETGAVEAFFCKNCSLLLALRLKVDGVCFFFFFVEGKSPSPLVSKEKEKLVPIFREKEKDSDLPTCNWQKSRHWDAYKASSFTGVVAIFAAFLNQKYLVGEPKNMLPDTFNTLSLIY